MNSGIEPYHNWTAVELIFKLKDINVYSRIWKKSGFDFLKFHFISFVSFGISFISDQRVYVTILRTILRNF